jgi:hypothetical protein
MQWMAAFDISYIILNSFCHVFMGIIFLGTPLIFYYKHIQQSFPGAFKTK